jgi:NAD(P)-dependent dehydrogenase (short-subunit alcohol dehydrogenase family)
MSTSPLEGKVILVTGAAKRIGRSIALRLASEGARVAVHYGTSRQEAAETAADCKGKIFQADISKVPEIERLFGEVERAYGRLDGLVNNAARYRPMKVLEASEEDWDWIHSVNLKSVFFSCQAGARLMLKTGGGKIVNLSSLGGIRPWSDYAPYCSSKAGVIMLTKVLAKALAPQIAVNSVAPGVIHFDEDMPPEVQRFVSATPMQRHGTGDEIAEAVTYFLTATSFVTGQILAVDGGLSLRA